MSQWWKFIVLHWCFWHDQVGKKEAGKYSCFCLVLLWVLQSYSCLINIVIFHTLYHVNSPLWEKVIVEIYCPRNHSLVYWHEMRCKYKMIKTLWTPNIFLSARLPHRCSRSCRPHPFKLEITWINCKAKTGWPILWWSSWTEGRKSKAL